MTRKYIRDYWDQKDLVLGVGRDGLLAVGRVVCKNGESYTHLKAQDVWDFMQKNKKELNLE